MHNRQAHDLATRQDYTYVNNLLTYTLATLGHPTARAFRAYLRRFNLDFQAGMATVGQVAYLEALSADFERGE